MSHRPELVLFDFGGVLLELNDPVRTFGIGRTPAEFSEIWLGSKAVQEHETGRIGPEAFGRRMVEEVGLPYSPEEFIRRFDSWPGRVSAKTSQLVKSISREIDCAILSNTNSRHWQAQDIEGDFGGRIGRLFLSFETGYVKPDPRAFRHVVAATGISPERILFIDDNPANVEAAIAERLRALLCANTHALEALLRDEGLVA